jgi:S1-C subfamily serine protease
VILEFLIAGGSRDGDRELLDQAVIKIGRHPLSDLRFDAETDRDVSARHAEVRVEDGRALLVDVGSTNGTFVNGKRITAPTPLASGDVIGFGPEGPKATVSVGETWASRPSASAAKRPTPETHISGPVHATDAHPVPPVKPAGATQERVRVAVKQETRKLSWIFGGAVAVVALLGAGAWWTQKQEADARAAELATLLARQDSLTAQFDAQLTKMSAQVGGLDSALLAAKREGSTLRSQLAAGGGADVRSRLLAVQDRQQRILSAAQMDYSTVVETSGRAVVMVAVEMPDGRVFSGSGFAANARGLIVTNRHLLRDESGAVAKRVGVIFSDTREWLPAKVVKVADGDDLGFLQLDAGTYPSVPALDAGSATRVGAPVAIIGYPLGTETPMEGSGTRITARSTLGAGTVSKLLSNVVQIDAFAGQGSSGSPVFDASGRVVGVVYGGATEAQGRIVYAVPIARLLAELPK